MNNALVFIIFALVNCGIVSSIPIYPASDLARNCSDYNNTNKQKCLAACQCVWCQSTGTL